MYTLATILAILCVNPCVLVDSNLAINAIQRFASAFTVEPVTATTCKTMTLGFFRNSVRFAHAELKDWSYERDGIVRFDTMAGNWFSIKCEALVSPFKFTKVVYRYTELWDEVPNWFHGNYTTLPDGVELNLIGVHFVPNGTELNAEWVNDIEVIYKGSYTVRESLLDSLKPISERYNSFGEFGFSCRKATLKDALLLARDRDEKDFIKWYIRDRNSH